jgi:hypothetical protein
MSNNPAILSDTSNDSHNFPMQLNNIMEVPHMKRSLDTPEQIIPKMKKVEFTEIENLMSGHPVEHFLTRPTEHVLTRPVEHVLTRPAEHVLTRPVEHVLTRPVEHVLTRPAERIISKPVEQNTCNTVLAECNVSKPITPLSNDLIKIFNIMIPKQTCGLTFILCVVGLIIFYLSKEKQIKNDEDKKQ